MKKLLLLVILVGALSGCYENTRRGYALDEIGRHSGNVRSLENKLAETNPAVIANMSNITVDTAANTESWLARMKKAAYDRAAKYDNNSSR